MLLITLKNPNEEKINKQIFLLWLHAYKLNRQKEGVYAKIVEELH